MWLSPTNSALESHFDDGSARSGCISKAKVESSLRIRFGEESTTANDAGCQSKVSTTAVPRGTARTRQTAFRVMMLASEHSSRYRMSGEPAQIAITLLYMNMLLLFCAGYALVLAQPHNINLWGKKLASFRLRTIDPSDQHRISSTTTECGNTVPSHDTSRNYSMSRLDKAILAKYASRACCK